MDNMIKARQTANKVIDGAEYDVKELVQAVLCYSELDKNLHSLLDIPELTGDLVTRIKTLLSRNTGYQLIPAYQIHGDSGSERNIGPVIGYCSTRSLALEVAKGKGWWGGLGSVQVCTLIKVRGLLFALASGNVFILDGLCKSSSAEYNLKISALAKLTEEERKALGH